MAIAQYNETFWFPDGTLASNIAARIFPLRSNALASIFTDVTGMVPLPNPLSTNGSGALTFWAEEGEYWVHMGAESFRVSVGSPGGLDVFEVAASAALSTGVISGGNTSIAGPTTITITEFVGYVVDHTGDPFRPTTTRIHQATQVVALVGASLTRTVTYWLVNAAGTLIQQGTAPTNTQRRTHIVLAVTSFDVATQTLGELAPLPQILPQPMGQIRDFMAAVGTFSTTGNAVSPNGANLRINVAAGSLFQPSWSYNTDPNNPHSAPTAAASPATFRYFTQNNTVFLPSTTLVDPQNYDVGGVITPVGGGVNRATIQRVYRFATSDVSRQTTIQYGQTVYANLAAAVAALGTTTYIPHPALALGALVGWIVVERTCTDLSNSVQAMFVRPTTRFPIP